MNAQEELKMQRKSQVYLMGQFTSAGNLPCDETRPRKIDLLKTARDLRFNDLANTFAKLIQLDSISKGIRMGRFINN